MRIIDARANGTKELFMMLEKRSHSEQTDVINAVASIINDIKKNGDDAVLKYTMRFDGVKLEKDKIQVSREEIEQAYKEVDKKLIEVIKKAANNINKFHERQKKQSWFSNEGQGVMLGQKLTALRDVGVYVPGGTAPLPSSVLMNVLPAKVAGVKNIIMCTPPKEGGKINSVILVAADIAGVDSIYKIGGSQAIAAMAFGTETVKKVDKIVGPGNIYVATAKKMVFGGYLSTWAPQ